MLHYEQVSSNVFERRESKCYAVLMKHHHKVKGEKVATNGSATKNQKCYCCTRTTILLSLCS